MVNQVVIVGRLTSDPEVQTLTDNKKKTTVVVAVGRAYKNVNGEYETDFIRCVLWNGVASSTCEYCHKGDVVGIKGRLEISSYEDEEKNKHYMTEVIAEKVTFLSGKKDSNEE